MSCNLAALGIAKTNGVILIHQADPQILPCNLLAGDAGPRLRGS